MKKSDQLKQTRKQKRDRLQELQRAAEKESRDYNESENTEIRSLLDEINGTDEKEGLDAQIRTAEQLEEQLRHNADKDKGGQRDQSRKDEKDLSKFSFSKMLRSASNPNARLEGVELEMDQEARTEMQRAGISPSDGSVVIPMVVLRNSNFGKGVEKRDLTAEGGSGTQGGVTIQEDVTGYIAALRNRSLLTTLGVDMMTGLTGNIKMPRENAVFAPTWEGENDATAESNPTYTSVTLSPERLAGYVDLSNQLLMQSSSSIENRIRQQILDGHAIALDAAGFAGTGANDQPTGILNDADISVVAIGTNGGALTDALIVDLEEKLDTSNALMGTLAYVMTPKGRRTLKLLPTDAGSGLFVWDRQTNQVNGYAAYSTNQLPSSLSKGTGSNLHSLVFGDFSISSATFAMWGGLEILKDPYTKATEGITRLVLNSYCDFAVLQPKKFAAIKDFDPTA